MPAIDVCADGDIPSGGHELVDIGGGIEVAVFFVNGRYYAIEDVCTHDDGPLAEGELLGCGEGTGDEPPCRIVCPRHGAQFDLTTGQALTLPAYRPVDAFTVHVRDGRVLLEA